MTTESKPFACPSCGASEWKADYYEAVWQTVTLYTSDDGAPVFGDYTGVTGTYDDPSTEDEAYRCAACDDTIPLGSFVMLPVGASATQDAIDQLEEKRGHHETRAERLRDLVNGGRLDPLGDGFERLSYAEGAAHAYGLALLVLRGSKVPA